MRTSIKRLYEADDIQQLPMDDAQAQIPMNGRIPQPQHQMKPPDQAASSAEMMPDFSFQDEPENQQLALPQPDVMTLTVQELIDRCNKINPLICMGLNQFIESNKEQLLNQTSGEQEYSHGEEQNNPDGETDLNFSNQMKPQAPQFSLDQPEADLEFPQE